MPAQFTIPLIVVVPGQIIAASLWNNEWNNIYVNLIPSGVDTYSNTDSQMQTSTDPFPAGSTSRPTSLAGEIERLRFVLNEITGNVYWYQPPAINLLALSTSTPVIPSGTVMLFYQAAAPTGWTLNTSLIGYMLRVDFGNGGTVVAGGTTDLASGIILAHSHTVNSHTHDLAAHTHTMANHTHTTPAHVHTLVNGTTAGLGGSVRTDVPVDATSGGVMNASSWSGGGTHTLHQTNATTNTGEGSGTSGTPNPNTSDGPTPNLSGATAPGTDTQLSNLMFKIANVIICSKN